MKVVVIFVEISDLHVDHVTILMEHKEVDNAVLKLGG
jgi:hypothetical protein